MEWDQFFGGTALILGLMFLLSNLAVVTVALLAAVLFVLAGGFCAVRHRQQVGFIAAGLGLVLLMPLAALPTVPLEVYRILAGSVLGFFGIAKLT